MVTIDEFVELVANNAKSKQWLNCTVAVKHPEQAEPKQIGIKAFGLWVQRIECNGLVDSVSEQKTKKQFKLMLTATIQAMFARGI